MVVFFFLSLWLIKLSGEIKGVFENKTMNCYVNYLFGYTLQLCLKYYVFFGDVLQGKDLSTDLHFLSSDTTSNIYLSLQLK